MVVIAVVSVVSVVSVALPVQCTLRLCFGGGDVGDVYGVGGRVLAAMYCLDVLHWVRGSKWLSRWLSD